MPLRYPDRPDWLRVRFPADPSIERLRVVMREGTLNTVCEEARCPNLGECWSKGTATFMILGDTCTRSCGFCAVKTGRPISLDLDEPRRVAEAVAKMGLRHAVITSVNRDELPDGGSSVFAETIRQVRGQTPGITIEVLIPDFKGDEPALRTVIEAGPEILNHNVETVPRLYRRVRPQADYRQSLGVLQRAKQMGAPLTKSGLMVGLGETAVELEQVFADLVRCEVDILTIGQYLQPTAAHLPVVRYVPPAEFESYRRTALNAGFRHVESGPLVRSSYHAGDQATTLLGDPQLLSEAISPQH